MFAFFFSKALDDQVETAYVTTPHKDSVRNDDLYPFPDELFFFALLLREEPSKT